MTTRKKLIITISIISIAILMAVTALVIVLVANNNQADSGVSVKYSATNVSVDLSARYLVGTDWSVMSTAGGETTLSLTPKVTSGTLSPTASTIKMNSDNYKIAFEYKFLSKMNDIGASIALNSTPATMENVVITYSYSNSQLSTIEEISNLAQNSTYDNQALGYRVARYVYILVEVEDLLTAAKLSGDFAWVLNRADVYKITYSLPGDAVGYDNYEYVLSGQTYSNLNTYPFVVNKMFLGWGTSSTATTPVAFPRSFSANTTYYPIYASGGYDISSFISYSSNNVYTVYFDEYIETTSNIVIPDLYNNGINGVAPVTIATGGMYDNDGTYRYDSNPGAIQRANALYVGNYVKNIGGLIQDANYYSYAGTISELYIGKSLDTIRFSGTEGTLGDHVYITNAHNLTKVYVVAGNKVYDSRDNCNAIIETATNTLITGSSSTSIPNSVVAIADGAFSNGFRQNTLLTNLTIPSSVKKIGNQAFYNCINLTTVTMSGSWYVSTSSTAISGTTVSVTTASTNATNLKSNYVNYYWFRTN